MNENEVAQKRECVYLLAQKRYVSKLHFSSSYCSEMNDVKNKKDCILEGRGEVRMGWKSEVTELILGTIKVSYFVLADCTN